MISRLILVSFCCRSEFRISAEQAIEDIKNLSLRCGKTGPQYRDWVMACHKVLRSQDWNRPVRPVPLKEVFVLLVDQKTREAEAAFNEAAEKILGGEEEFLAFLRSDLPPQ